MARRILLLLVLLQLGITIAHGADDLLIPEQFPGKSIGDIHSFISKRLLNLSPVPYNEFYATHLYHLASQLELAALDRELSRLSQHRLWRLLALYRAELARADLFMASYPDDSYPLERWTGRIMPQPERRARQAVRSIMTLIESKLVDLQADRILVGRYLGTLSSGSLYWIELQDQERHTLICYDMANTIAPKNYRFNPHDLLRFWLKRDDYLVGIWAILKFEIAELGQYQEIPGADPSAAMTEP